MNQSPSTPMECRQLRWRCDPERFSFETTAELEIQDSVVGQETAQDALTFGIECLAHGQNVYVRGPRGTGRITMVRQLFRRLEPKTTHNRDRCFVNNFSQPDRPRLISLAPGKAPQFQRRVAELAEFIDTGLKKALDKEPYLSQRESVKEQLEAKLRGVTEPLEKELAEHEMALVSMQQGPVASTAIFPRHDGQPVPPDQLKSLIAEGKAPQEKLEKYEKAVPRFQKELEKKTREVSEIFREGKQEIERIKQESAKFLLSGVSNQIIYDFPGQGVSEFVHEVVKDAVENRLDQKDESIELSELYDVNVVLTHSDATSSPVIEEVVPNLINLLGTVETTWDPQQGATSSFRGIRGGALLSADGGYLILDVEDLLAEPGAYRAIMRTLRTRRLEIVPPEAGWMRPYVVIQPEPIEINVRVILIGDVETYYMLDAIDPDFRELFKVLADFEDQISRDDHGLNQYTTVVARLARDEDLLPFHRDAVAALVEHGARIVSRSHRLTAKFGRIADIAREAAFLAGKDGRGFVTGDDVRNVVRRTKQRGNLPSRRFLELIENGTINVEIAGSRVGQINGLAVIHAGPLTYGFPARITATIGPGTAGLINIEGHAHMSGSIHTKGFHILAGLLRNLLKTEHPLSFSASLAFEQSYGGIDGDSASGAEMICLLSALTGVPIRQDLAITGAIDQIGYLQAIGGVNEKIEGFFDVCTHMGLSGSQGVVIPQSNAGDLMLRHDVVQACSDGKFHVYSVENICDALALFTGQSTGCFEDGKYSDGTLMALAVDKARDYWEKTLLSPQRLTTVSQAQEQTPPTIPLPRRN